MSQPRKEISPASVTVPEGHPWKKWGKTAFVLGVMGLLASAALPLAAAKHGGAHGAHGPWTQFFFSYLTAFAYWLSIALGGLFFVLVQFSARAGWSVVVRRIGEYCMATLPLFAIFFIPIVLGMHDLYHWTHKDVVATDAVLQHKAIYLNTPFFLARAAFYFLTWTGLSVYYYKKSQAQDVSGDPNITRRLQFVSAPGLVLFAITISFAAFDWLMSLEPHWFSTMFGVYYFSGSVVGIFALLSLVSVAARRAGLVGNLINQEHFHDVGKFLFAFTVFWAYIAYSQYMLIWYANMPEETIWYAQRWVGGWKSISVLIGVGHFAVPFFFLMSRHIKRADFLLYVGAMWMLIIHYVDIYWLVMPTLHKDLHISALDLTTMVGIGGIIMGTFFTLMSRRPLVPLKDPRLSESVAHENF